MGDALKKSARSVRKSTLVGFDPDINKKINRTIEKPFRKGASAEKREAKANIAKQQQKESASLAEKDDEIARRRSRAAQGGRSSLIKSATPGLATNLGGTQ
jgi:hypothetical protein